MRIPFAQIDAFTDALHVALLRGADLDRDYLSNWAPALDGTDGLARLLNEVDGASPGPGSNP